MGHPICVQLALKYFNSYMFLSFSLSNSTIDVLVTYIGNDSLSYNYFANDTRSFAYYRYLIQKVCKSQSIYSDLVRSTEIIAF